MINPQLGLEYFKFAPKVDFKVSSRRYASCCSSLKSGKTWANLLKRRAWFRCVSFSICRNMDSQRWRKGSACFLQCCKASEGNKCVSKESCNSRLTKPDSETTSCATDRLSTFGLSSFKTPWSRSPKGRVSREQQRISSLMCLAHMLKTTFGSSMGSTCRGGPGTNSFLFKEASKRLFTASLGDFADFSIFSRSWAHLVRSPFALGKVEGFGLESAIKADMYLPMKSSRQATSSCCPSRSDFSFSFTLTGSELKTLDSWKSTLNMVGIKSSSSHTPAECIASFAFWQERSKASTKLPKVGIGLSSLGASCKYKHEKHVWTMVWPSSHSKKYIKRWSMRPTNTSGSSWSETRPSVSAFSSVISSWLL